MEKKLITNSFFDRSFKNFIFLKIVSSKDSSFKDSLSFQENCSFIQQNFLIKKKESLLSCPKRKKNNFLFLSLDFLGNRDIELVCSYAQLAFDQWR